MLARRLALAVGLLLAVVFSQAPEFLQQYRQRLGGGLDELRRAIAVFDAEAAALSLGRDAAVDRLRANPDPLAAERGADLAEDVRRLGRLEAQERAFAEAGPLARYWVFIERLDPAIASRAWSSFEPAVPATAPGFAAAGVGFVLGYGGMRGAGAPFRRRRRTAAA